MNIPQQSSGSTKPKAEQTNKIDIRKIYKKGLLEPGVASTIHWSSNGTVLSKTNMTSTGTTLIINTQPGQWISLAWTNCHFGGQRPWFRCPTCNRRVAVLYKISQLFSCSQCNNISYYSRCQSPLVRLLRKKNKLRKRITFDDDWGLDFFRKPKGMHRKTYGRLLNEFGTIEQQIDDHVEDHFGEKFQ